MNNEELIGLLDELRTLQKETEWVEFKVNKSIPDMIGKYISGLANSACLENKDHAYLIFGIEDETHEVVGTTFYPCIEKRKGQELENWLRTQLQPRSDFKVYELDYKEKHIAIFEIDAATHIPIRFRNVSYIRIGSYLKELKDHPEKEAKIWKNAKRIAFEDEFALRNIAASKVFTLLNWRVFFELLGIPIPENNNRVILDKLVEENLIFRRGDKYDITNLGAILFARNINDFDELKRKAPRVIIYKGNNKFKTIKEQTGKFGYAVGFAGMIDYIIDRLPSNEEIGRVYREEVKVYPELAIRELIVNAIIHQDLTITGTSPMVEIFDDRIEITNPGKPLIDTRRFIDHSPLSRNEKLASLMRRMNFCEERGSGIDKVIMQVELFQLPAPLFTDGESFTRIIVFAPKTLRQMDRIDKIRATYQHCCLKYVSGDMMSNQSLRGRFDIDEKNYSIVSRIIRESIEEGVIKPYDPSNNSKKYAKYIPYWA